MTNGWLCWNLAWRLVLSLIMTFFVVHFIDNGGLYRIIAILGVFINIYYTEIDTWFHRELRKNESQK